MFLLCAVERSFRGCWTQTWATKLSPSPPTKLSRQRGIRWENTHTAHTRSVRLLISAAIERGTFVSLKITPSSRRPCVLLPCQVCFSLPSFGLPSLSKIFPPCLNFVARFPVMLRGNEASASQADLDTVPGLGSKRSMLYRHTPRHICPHTRTHTHACLSCSWMNYATLWWLQSASSHSSALVCCMWCVPAGCRPCLGDILMAALLGEQNSLFLCPMLPPPSLDSPTSLSL